MISLHVSKITICNVWQLTRDIMLTIYTEYTRVKFKVELYSKKVSYVCSLLIWSY